MERSALSVGGLRAGYLTDPLGIDQRAPELSWVLGSPRRNQSQSAYQVRAAGSRENLARGMADRWDSGKVAGSSTSVAYGGSALRSREVVWWQVRVWDRHGQVSSWSTPARFELGLLEPADWTAEWIGNPAWREPEPQPLVLTLPRQDARFVRLDVSRLGKPIKENGFPQPVSRLQLAEIVVRDSADQPTNLALGSPVTASESFTVPGYWEPRFVTDGSLTSEQPPLGYTSFERHEQDLGDTPISLTLDLGSVHGFDQVLLFPRTDVTTDTGETAGFPVDFTLRTDVSVDGPFPVAADITGQAPPPPYRVRPDAQPLFAKPFTVDTQVRAARLYVTGLGVFEATLNGAPVGTAVLEPGNTDYRTRVEYSTYDVTDLVRQGGNTLGIQLGNGMYHVPATPGRYTKLTRSDGPLRMLAQLELTNADGTRTIVSSDESWRTALGGTTFSGWFGGEDFDARRARTGWDRPGGDLSGWDTAVASPLPTGTTLSARAAPPIVVTERLRPHAITQPRPGAYVVDFGVNFAGWPQLRAAAPAGTTVLMWPGEQLNPDGTVSQRSTGSPIYDRYTFAGTGQESWQPRFSYHGFRYLQLEGLPSAPTADTVTGLVLRAANERAGSFTSSNPLLNKIHGIIDRAIQSNMYSVLTDCPHREKLGWLEEGHLVFSSVASNYDVAAYYRSLIRTIAEAQTPDGLVPDIAPEYTVFAGGFRDDPNWGGALVLAPLRMYRTYGDVATLGTYYPAMRRYLEYLGGKAQGNLLDYGLGDWIAIDESTPLGVTASFAYHRLATAMAEIAGILGKDADRAEWTVLADAIGTAFNARYLDRERHTYASGSQASDALALDLGVVPAEERLAVLGHLIAGIEAAGDHVTVGEIALPSLFRVLSAAGRDDVVYRIASRTDHPSYGYQVVNGATSLTEKWDGPTARPPLSQNHFMLGAIDAWFTSGLAGIRQAPDSVAYTKLEIRPAVVGDLTEVTGRYRTPSGEVISGWHRDGARVELTVTVPVNTTATVYVPVRAGTQATGAPDVRPIRVEGGCAVFTVGSGEWRFRGHVPSISE